MSSNKSAIGNEYSVLYSVTTLDTRLTLLISISNFRIYNKPGLIQYMEMVGLHARYILHYTPGTAIISAIFERQKVFGGGRGEPSVFLGANDHKK